MTNGREYASRINSQTLKDDKRIPETIYVFRKGMKEIPLERESK